MKKSKLITLFRTFQQRDFRRFREYLASPFFNKRQDLVELYAILETLAPGFPEQEVGREQIWKRYAPNKPIDEKELNYAMNFLLKHAENYLAIESFQNGPTAKGTQTLDYCLENGLEKQFRSVYQRTRKALEGEPHRDWGWHLKAWRLADAQMQHFYSTRSRSSSDAIARVVDHLDAFYLDKKLELSSEILNLNQILKEGHDTSFIRNLMDRLEEEGTQAPSVEIRMHILKLLLYPDDTSSFFTLRKMLHLTHQLFSPDKVQGIFNYAQNFCIRRIKAGDPDYETHLFRLYQESIDSKVIYEAGQLNPWTFKNICSVALKLGEYDWTGQFIAAHEKKIPLDFRSNAIAYNQANLFFHQQKFAQALRTLAKVEFTDIFYALDTRRMMLMIYFEREDSDALFSLISAFRVYLHRNRIVSEQNRLAYKNFVDWLAKLYRMSPGERALQGSNYAAEIAQTHPVVEKAWLLRQLA